MKAFMYLLLIFSGFFFFFFWLCWIFVTVPGPHLVATSRAILHCSLFEDLWWLLLLRSTALGIRASVVVAHRLSCSSACGIYLDLDRPLH